jgi:hypothetical protein
MANPAEYIFPVNWLIIADKSCHGTKRLNRISATSFRMAAVWDAHQKWNLQLLRI